MVVRLFIDRAYSYFLISRCGKSVILDACCPSIAQHRETL
ncbi:hypothetical protein GBAG_2149 [Buttiauxella agrestis ATCC 33320]|uniref:Uncharacterized protein n=1 Tax=Buttiauxella agrestis ATCC 33320 TaxID=1006004 RepID=A0A085GCC4_9ENTR|nr:hypothetical protein GBAG_2149 [Buttiauxella agrestis ATCC 33320]